MAEDTRVVDYKAVFARWLAQTCKRSDLLSFIIPSTRVFFRLRLTTNYLSFINIAHTVAHRTSIAHPVRLNLDPAEIRLHRFDAYGRVSRSSYVKPPNNPSKATNGFQTSTFTLPHHNVHQRASHDDATEARQHGLRHRPSGHHLSCHPRWRSTSLRRLRDISILWR